MIFNIGLIVVALLSVSLQAATVVLDSNSFFSDNQSAPGIPGGVIATSTFNLNAADIPNVSFESNFTFLDAGVEVIVNGVSLFSTGADVSNFRPSGTAFVEDLFNPFDRNGNVNNIPRLTVSSDATGTSFVGSTTTTASTATPLTPNFAVANFTSLLQSGSNTIEILNLNSFGGNGLGGSFEVCLDSVPEPSSLVFLAVGFLGVLGSRKRVV